MAFLQALHKLLPVESALLAVKDFDNEIVWKRGPSKKIHKTAILVKVQEHGNAALCFVADLLTM